MTTEEIRAVLEDVCYRDWRIDVWDYPPSGYMQVSFEAPDGETGVVEIQRGRKWRLSPHMTRSEVVQTAFLAVLTAEEHECREQFLYRGRPVFGPHIDVEALFAACVEHDARATKVGQHEEV